MIIIIDNYDSFTYNLYQYIGEINPDIKVFRNNKISVEEVLNYNPSHIILSPGPGYPESAGICISLIQELINQNLNIPLLGVCLGHQSIGHALGGKIIKSPQIMHGKSDTIFIDNTCKLFSGLEEKITVGRYHSLVIENDSLPDCINVTAKSENNLIMAIAHKDKPIYGVQFHPESILTDNGKTILENFLNI